MHPDYARRSGLSVGEADDLRADLADARVRAEAAESALASQSAAVSGLVEAGSAASAAIRMTALAMESPLGPRVTKRHIAYWTSLFHRESRALSAALTELEKHTSDVGRPMPAVCGANAPSAAASDDGGRGE